MRKIILAVLLTVAASPAMATTSQVCLNVEDISGSSPNHDGSAITFTMRDGKVWRNDLKGRCPDLAFNGFSWVLHGPTEVCDNSQSIRVLQSGEVCELGKFTQVTPVPRPRG